MKKVSQGSELTGDFPDTAPEPRSQNSETYFLRYNSTCRINNIAFDLNTMYPDEDQSMPSYHITNMQQK